MSGDKISFVVAEGVSNGELKTVLINKEDLEKHPGGIEAYFVGGRVAKYLGEVEVTGDTNELHHWAYESQSQG